MPRLIDVAPELVQELVELLREEGEDALADATPDLLVVDRCRCGDSFCATFYPEPKKLPWHGLKTIALVPEVGMLNVNVVNGRIVQVEVLDNPKFRAKLLAALP